MQDPGNQTLLVYRDLDATEQYASAIELVGLRLRLGEAKPSLRLGSCSGLLLMGGSDVNPALYDESLGEQTEAPDDERDAVESTLIDEALSRGIPILAICRGLQMLNVHLGGSLIQHLGSTARHRKRTPDRGLPAHQITIEPETLLASIANDVRIWDVNSRHHQAIARLGTGLRINARDPEDGTIEGVEMPGHRFVLAVQWHPENQVPGDAAQTKLFESFAKAISDG